MSPDASDTIVAIATPRGPAARGVVRLAGPDAVRVLERLAINANDVDVAATAARATRVAGVSLRVPLDGAPRSLPADVFVWPDARSYTRQPAVELHTVGSPPVLDALVNACVAAGARLAEPGEFTLRAFLAGRLDLIQAEAVLAVIDARHEGLLSSALGQLAGGLSGPLERLRADLLGLLADLEAGLDFVEEEDVRFVEPTELVRRLEEARMVVAETVEQMRLRGGAAGEPRVAIVGPPNIGKSRLFNALVERYGIERDAATRPAIVADQPGVTRDDVAAGVACAGVAWRLIDTAGVDGEDAPDAADARDTIDAAARARSATMRDEADLLVVCHDAATGADASASSADTKPTIDVATRVDLAPTATATGGVLGTSAATGEGVDHLARAIAERLGEIDAASASEVVASTARRCRAGLEGAAAALDSAAAVAAVDGGEELVAPELRAALDGLGRVVGAVVTDEVLGEIFGRFCIGK